MRFARMALAAAMACRFATTTAQAAVTLAGWALMPADAFAPGPTSGPVAGTCQVMPDNGFGTKANSPDALLRL